MVTGFRGLDYNIRLNKFGTMTLETRRERSNLIQIFKNVKGLEEVDF